MSQPTSKGVSRRTFLRGSGSCRGCFDGRIGSGRSGHCDQLKRRRRRNIDFSEGERQFEDRQGRTSNDAVRRVALPVRLDCCQAG